MERHPLLFWSPEATSPSLIEGCCSGSRTTRKRELERRRRVEGEGVEKWCIIRPFLEFRTISNQTLSGCRKFDGGIVVRLYHLKVWASLLSWATNGLTKIAAVTRVSHWELKIVSDLKLLSFISSALMHQIFIELDNLPRGIYDLVLWGLGFFPRLLLLGD